MPKKDKAAVRAADAERRARNRAYVAEIRAHTFCARCGAQPVDFHCAEHDEHPDHRVTRLVGNGSAIERIAREIALCEPLCRRCHMHQDGRIVSFLNSRKEGRQRGEGNPAAVLTWEQVREIRRLHAETGESASSLGRRYGMTSTAIRFVIQGKTWKETVS
jgi:hypothetical protein